MADVVGGQAGLVIPCEKEQLKQALEDMLGNDKMRHEFSKKGKTLVYQRFNVEKIAEQVESVYQAILTKR